MANFEDEPRLNTMSPIPRRLTEMGSQLRQEEDLSFQNRQDSQNNGQGDKSEISSAFNASQGSTSMINSK